MLKPAEIVAKVKSALGSDSKSSDADEGKQEQKQVKSDDTMLRLQDFNDSPVYEAYPQAVCTFGTYKKTDLVKTYNDLLCLDFTRMLEMISGAQLREQLKERQQQQLLAQPLSGEQLQQLVQKHHFGNLQELTTADLQEALGTREWKKLCNLLFADVSSYFCLDPNDSKVLVCHMPEYLAQVRFTAPEDGQSEDSAALMSCSCHGMALGTSRAKAEDSAPEADKDDKDDKKKKAKYDAQDYLVQDVEPLTNFKAANFILQSGMPLTQAVHDKLMQISAKDPDLAAVADASQEFASSKARIAEANPCQHMYMASLLYLMLTKQLQCDDALYQLFYKREQYADYFAQVRTLISQILTQGLSNLNYDLLEMTKAAYVRANSFDIGFLVKALSELHSVLKVALVQRKEVSVKAVLEISSRIYNTLEALDHASDRKDLIKLYGLNQDREYAVPSITLLGCGYQHVKKSNDDTIKCFYFYCPERQEFVVIRAMVNSFFASPTLFMDTEVSLYDAVLRCYRVENAMFSAGKLKNSKYSRPQEYVLSLEQKKELYNDIVLPDFATLRTKAYAEVPRYFDQQQFTNRLYLVKVKGLTKVEITRNQPFLKAYFTDSAGQSLAVRVPVRSSNFESLRTIKEYREKLELLFARLEKSPALVERCVFSASARAKWQAYQAEHQLKQSKQLQNSQQDLQESQEPLESQKPESAKDKAETKRKKDKYQPQNIEAINKFLALEEPDTFFANILLDCPIVSGRIHPVLAAAMPLSLPDRRAEVDEHLKLRRFHGTYKGKHESSPLVEFCHSYNSLVAQRVLQFLYKNF